MRVDRRSRDCADGRLWTNAVQPWLRCLSPRDPLGDGVMRSASSAPAPVLVVPETASGRDSCFKALTRKSVAVSTRPRRTVGTQSCRPGPRKIAHRRRSLCCLCRRPVRPSFQAYRNQSVFSASEVRAAVFLLREFESSRGEEYGLILKDIATSAWLQNVRDVIRHVVLYIRCSAPGFVDEDPALEPGMRIVTFANGTGSCASLFSPHRRGNLVSSLFCQEWSE